MQHSAVKSKSRMIRKKNQTKKRLMDAAITLVLQKNYDKVATDDITELADVGRRTFYNHFINKNQCILSAIKVRYAAYSNTMDSVATLTQNKTDCADKDHALIIATMAAQIFQLISLDPITKKLMRYPRILNEAITDSQRDSLAIHITEGMASGQFKPSVSVETLEPIISWGFLGLAITAIERNSQITDSYIWAGFLLQNLGLKAEVIESLLVQINALCVHRNDTISNNGGLNKAANTPNLYCE